MITVTKEFSWDMSHMLAEHEGLCKNLHGHTYRMEVTVAKREGSLEDEGSKAGMVIDFKDLKKLVKEEIVNPLDHCFMYWTHSPDEIEHQLAQILRQSDRKVFAVDFRPTAEMMSIYFFQSLEGKFNEIDIDLVSVKVWETPTSYAEFRGEGHYEDKRV